VWPGRWGCATDASAPVPAAAHTPCELSRCQGPFQLLALELHLTLAEAQAIVVPRSRLTEFDIIAREVTGWRTRFEAIEKR
jgi:hypothetical protein